MYFLTLFSLRWNGAEILFMLYLPDNKAQTFLFRGYQNVEMASKWTNDFIAR